MYFCFQSRSKLEDPELLKLKQKAKEVSFSYILKISSLLTSLKNNHALLFLGILDAKG